MSDMPRLIAWLIAKAMTMGRKAGRVGVVSDISGWTADLSGCRRGPRQQMQASWMWVHSRAGKQGAIFYPISVSVAPVARIVYSFM